MEYDNKIHKVCNVKTYSESVLRQYWLAQLV